MKTRLFARAVAFVATVTAVGGLTPEIVSAHHPEISVDTECTDEGWTATYTVNSDKERGYSWAIEGGVATDAVADSKSFTRKHTLTFDEANDSYHSGLTRWWDSNGNKKGEHQGSLAKAKRPNGCKAPQKVYFCHATGSETNPFEIVHVSPNSAHKKHPNDKGPYSSKPSEAECPTKVDQPKKVEPAAPGFVEGDCAAAPIVDAPETDAYTVVVSGTVDFGQSVTVTFVAKDGYKLTGQTTYQHTFDLEPSYSECNDTPVLTPPAHEPICGGTADQGNDVVDVPADTDEVRYTLTYVNGIHTITAFWTPNGDSELDVWTFAEDTTTCFTPYWDVELNTRTYCANEKAAVGLHLRNDSGHALSVRLIDPDTDPSEQVPVDGTAYWTVSFNSVAIDGGTFKLRLYQNVDGKGYSTNVTVDYDAIDCPPEIENGTLSATGLLECADGASTVTVTAEHPDDLPVLYEWAWNGESQGYAGNSQTLTMPGTDGTFTIVEAQWGYDGAVAYDPGVSVDIDEPTDCDDDTTTTTTPDDETTTTTIVEETTTTEPKSLTNEPTIEITALSPVCHNDAPYIEAIIDGSDELAGQPATIEFIDINGDVVETHTRTFEPGEVMMFVYPGASVADDGTPTDWPGWELVGDQWVPDTSDADLQQGVTVRVTVNPSAVGRVDYPAATTSCATPPIVGVSPMTPTPESPSAEDSSAVSPQAEQELSGTLPATGASNTMAMAAIATALAALGGAAIVFGRRRGVDA